MLYDVVLTDEQVKRENAEFRLLIQDLLMDQKFHRFFAYILEKCKYFKYYWPINADDSNGVNNLLIREGMRGVAADLCMLLDSVTPGITAQIIKDEVERRNNNVRNSYSGS